MTNFLLSVALLATTVSLPVNSFSVLPRVSASSSHVTATIADATVFQQEQQQFTALFSSEGDAAAEEEEPPKLILDAAAVNEELNQYKSKYPTEEADYLAAARKRAEERRESVNNMSTDAEWKKAASDKTIEMGGTVEDAWEQSAKEAGNEDSQILIPIMDTTTEGGSGDDIDTSEPTLLL